MTRVAFITGSMPPDRCGVADYTGQLATALLNLDSSLEILVLTKVGQVLSTPFQVKPVVQIWNFRGVWCVLKELHAFQPEVVHLQYPTMAYTRHPAITLLPWFIRIAIWLGWLKSNLLLITLHEYASFRLLGRWRIRLMLLPVSQVIAVDPLTLHLLRKYLKFFHKSGYYIPIGSNVGKTLPSAYLSNPIQWRRNHKLRDDLPVIAYFGFVSPSKGLDTLLQAVAQLNFSVQLLLIADRKAQNPAYQPYFEHIIELEQQLDEAKTVIWTDFQPGPEVLAYLSCATVIALPFSDGISPRRGSLQAALSSGRPVITTKPTNMEQSRAAGFVENENILLVEPNAPTELAHALEILLVDTELQTKLGLAALQLMQRFDWVPIAQQHLRVYCANAVKNRFT